MPTIQGGSASYRSIGVIGTWATAARYSLLGGVLGGAVMGVLAGASTGSPWVALVGAPIGLLYGLAISAVAALCVALPLAWFLHIGWWRGRSVTLVVRASRSLVVGLTATWWAFLWWLLDDDKGLGFAEGIFWLILVIMVGFGWWATRRVVNRTSR